MLCNKKIRLYYATDISLYIIPTYIKAITNLKFNICLHFIIIFDNIWREKISHSRTCFIYNRWNILGIKVQTKKLKNIYQSAIYIDLDL